MSNTSDTFDSVTSPQLYSNSNTFLTLLRSAIYDASSPLAAARRFPLRSLTIHKKIILLSQHECSSARLKDREKPEDHLLLFVERNASKDPSTRPNNKSTLEMIKESLVPSNSLAFSKGSSKSLDHTPSPPTPSSTDSVIPLIPINPSSESSESSEFGISSLTMGPTLSSNRPGPTLLQRASLASTQSVRVIHESFAEVHDAEDMILGTGFCDTTKGSYGHGRVVREVILPNDTEFGILDLAILIDVIHLYAPIYSLFENHCYWLVQILSDSVVAIAGADCVDDDQDSDMNNEVYQPPSNRLLPPSSYLPALCGRWNGILVSQVRKEVLVTVLSEFWKRRTEEMTEVHFLQLYYHFLLNFLKIERRQGIIDGHLSRDVELEELRRKAEIRDEELESLRSDMSAVQAEVLTLRRKLHLLGGNREISSEVCQTST
jgi:hypothetical protein